jgi:hypothetical protein
VRVRLHFSKRPRKSFLSVDAQRYWDTRALEIKPRFQYWGGKRLLLSAVAMPPLFFPQAMPAGSGAPGHGPVGNSGGMATALKNEGHIALVPRDCFTSFAMAGSVCKAARLFATLAALFANNL